MEITGKLILALGEVNGSSSNGGWRKKDFVIETDGQYPKKVCFTVWKDLIDSINNVAIGSKLTVSIDAESKEHNGRWYTDLKAWKYDVIEEAVAENMVESNPIDEFNANAEQEADDGLPY